MNYQALIDDLSDLATRHAGDSAMAALMTEAADEIEKLRQYWEFLESRFEGCSPKMNGSFTWRHVNLWPPLIGQTFEDAVREAISAIAEANE